MPTFVGQTIYSAKTIETLIQFEYSAFEEATVPICTFALRNRKLNKNGCYFRLTDFRGGMEVQRQKTLEAIADHKCGFYYESNAANFAKIPGAPVAYWVSEAFVRAFEKGALLGDLVPVKKGMDTGDNDYFLKLWYEVDYLKIDLYFGEKKWIPYDKGGNYRKWYGNNEYILNWENDGKELKAIPHRAGAEDTPSDFSSDCIEMTPLGWRPARNFCAR